MGWLATTRAILELLYFASGVAIAIFAFLGLRQVKLGLEQLRITKEIANTNAKREAVKLAAEQCRYFAEDCVRAMTEAHDEYHKKGFKFLTPHPAQGQPPFLLQNGEIISHSFDLKALNDEMLECGSVVLYLNSLEAFAIPFAAGLANEDIGFTETARPFCQGLQEAMPALFQLRQTNRGRYESAVKLYEMWSRRLAAEAAAPVMQ
jgi:hypothetical protein